MMSRTLLLWLLGTTGCSSGAIVVRSPMDDGAAPAPDGSAMAVDSGGADADGVAEGPDADASASVSFTQDVMPIFQHSCAVGGAMCHGDPSVVTNGQGTGGNRAYLGSLSSAGDSAMILAGLVGQPSFEDPSMSVVTAGSPTTSYLMLKMDGTLAPLATACASGSLSQCGASMPLGATLLPQATRDTVRTWIAQGALND